MVGAPPKPGNRVRVKSAPATTRVSPMAQVLPLRVHVIGDGVVMRSVGGRKVGSRVTGATRPQPVRVVRVAGATRSHINRVAVVGSVIRSCCDTHASHMHNAQVVCYVTTARHSTLC